MDEVRRAYDVVARDYAAHFSGERDHGPYVLELLAGLAQRVGSGLVADLGCGPATLTAHLAAHGVDVVGLDLSEGMLSVARARHPALPLAAGDLRALPLADGSLVGAVAAYCLIHLPPEDRPRACRELHRVLRPGGHALVAFQVGDDVLRVDEPFGHPVSLSFRRLQPHEVAAELEAAGFEVLQRHVREADPARAETAAQGYLLVRSRTTGRD